jgi:23S rRNA pseudouridine955/2504/2580 synthase
MKQLDIIYEDDSCIVINKPAGLAVQGGKGIAVSLDSLLTQMRSERPLLVHRLDRDTSGLILAAKTKTAAAAYSRLLAEKTVIKRYLAVCKGKPDQREGVIRDELLIHGNMKKSETHYRLLRAGEEFSLMELELGTGRMHQIRRHLAMSGTPILGDDKYGDFDLNHKLRKDMKLRHLLLHAARLIIPQTPDGKNLDLTAPPPEYFSFLYDTLSP